MSRILKITDGTTSVEFVDGTGNLLHLVEFRSQIAGYKSGGTFQSSPLTHGRQLVDTKYDNIIDTIEFTVQDGASQNASIAAVRTLLQLLVKAAAYWTDPRQRQPVWLEDKSDFETNKRYALIVTGQVPELADMYGIEFLQNVLLGMSCIIEHKLWQSTQPGAAGTEVPLVRNSHEFSDDFALKVLGYDPVAGWKFDETSGTTAASYVDSPDQDATYDAGVDFDDPSFVNGETAVFVPATTDSIDIYSTALNAVFDGDEGSILFPMRYIDGFDVWDDFTPRYFIQLYIDADNYITIRKTDDNSGEIEVDRTAGGVSVKTYIQELDTAEWLFVVATWSLANNRLRVYLGNVLTSQNSGLLAMLGSLDSGACWVGEGSVVSSENLAGDASHVFIWDTELTQAQIDDITDPWTPTPVSSTADDVYIGNKHTLNNFSHIFYYDDSSPSFSDNFAGIAAVTMLPAVPAADDAIYFGIYDGINPIPFSSIVFNLGTPSEGITGEWRYWGGSSWATPDVQDGTSGLTQSGSVHWPQPTNWVANEINGVTTYWIRFGVTAVSSPTAPANQTIAPYTARLPYISMRSTVVSGDIEALARLLFQNRSDSNKSGEQELWTNRIICGLRTYETTDRFQAFINLTGLQNETGISMLDPDGSNATSSGAPTGQAFVWSGAVQALTHAIGVKITAPAVAYYSGRFRVFLRARQSGGTAGDIGVQLRFFDQDNAVPTNINAVRYFDNTQNWQLLDLGEVAANEGLADGEEPVRLLFALYVTSTSATPDLHLYDLVLIPTDEWFADIIDKDNSANSRLGINPNSPLSAPARLLDIDSILNPRRHVRALIRDYTSQIVRTSWRVRAASGQVNLANNKSQRLYVLAGRFIETGSTTMDYDPSISHTVRIQKSQRYLGHRGTL